MSCENILAFGGMFYVHVWFERVLSCITLEILEILMTVLLTKGKVVKVITV